ncbi:All-trans retinoic acid induced differentiation factor [Podarcis lilfordi]|uniref:All-trans retinoic acid induced differentiation factor n=1 Tax=Podarcis lilfordi TaxID=74358 RepID=A0AA35K6F1_9SAUR|nr:All-trans retinoic acid induced differentiation factor [Podarcis lilfordi]
MAAPRRLFRMRRRLLLLPLLGFCLAAAAGGNSGELPAVCGGGCCPGRVRNGSAVAAQCASRPGARLRGRCCCSGGQAAAAAAVVLGLDLGNCSLQQLCSSFQEASMALLIDLTDNPLEPLPEDAFRGFTQLQTLALPLTLDCPGGNEGWDNVTVQGSSRICHGQRNPCNGSGGLGHLCPKDSLCSHDGPGLPQCLCTSPHYGYKCLRQGTFPYLLFFGALGAVTIALSLLLWVTQRRKAKVS